MRVVWRAVVVLAVFVIIGWCASHVVMRHELLAKPGAPFAEVRLVSWAAGLFAGSLAALLVGIALILKRGR